jgi:N-acetylgalactosamine kinase
LPEIKKKRLIENTVVVILAAGKGSRMGKEDMAKVCFEIDGVPAIIRLINSFKKKGYQKILVVVGSNAQQVMETVSKEYPEVIFVYQTPQLGTGHAAKFAADVLQTINHQNHVLLTMGDKYIEEDAFELLTDGFIRRQADLALLTIPKNKRTIGSGGRVLVDKNDFALAIIESIDLAKQTISDELNKLIDTQQPVTYKTIKKIIERNIPIEKKQKLAVAELLPFTEKNAKIKPDELQKLLANKEYKIVINGKKYTADQIEKNCLGVNPSLYLCNAKAFYTGIKLLKNDNAQNEYYLTDIVKLLAAQQNQEQKSSFRVIAVPVKYDTIIQGFNSPDELLAIQDYVRRTKFSGKSVVKLIPEIALKKTQYKTVKEWIKRFEEKSNSLSKWLTTIYGNHEDLHIEKCQNLKNTLECYGKQFGFDKKVVIVRAPGRVNLMGRHVDHRGGYNNFLAIDRETIMIAGLREDDNVYAVNTNPEKFSDQQFNISELIGHFGWNDWINFVESDWVRNILRTTAGDWGNYIKAAMLRLQHKYTDLKINGLNIALSGNIPMAAGLSSSSSIVVATLQAAIGLNRLELTTRQFIDLCGEGEWFVGSRGGAGDHAAIYLGESGKIVNVGYFPFRVEKIIDAPENFQVVIANSHIKAAKSSEAKHTFNQKICSYNLGLELLKLRSPEISNQIEFLRDFNPERLGWTTSDIYKCLKKIPQFMTRKEFESMLPSQYRDMLTLNFSSHTEPKYYNVRGVLLFGIAEILRSKMCTTYLKNNEIEKFGNLMQISHDGDRVSIKSKNNKYRFIQDTCSDEFLDKLVSDLKSENPDRVLQAQLYLQPGSYGCSTPGIDQMVDISNTVAGVVGAQIAGAGLGGCIMILVEKEKVNNVREALEKNYYAPKKLEPEILPCITVKGASLVEL